MTLDILICTHNERIGKIPPILLPPQKNIRYIVSFQVSNNTFREAIPPILREREDVQIHLIEGYGLAKNRNEALRCAKSDICLIADDDVRYTLNHINVVLHTFEMEKTFDMLLFKANTEEGTPLKRYPTTAFNYGKRPRGYYPSSVEIAFRRTAVQQTLFFNEHFGLGSELFGCGEDELFVHQAHQKGLNVQYIPQTIVTTYAATTGTSIYEKPSLQRAKGAVLWSIYGKSAKLRCLKFALLSFAKRKAPFWSLWHELNRGIQQAQKLITKP